MYSRFIKLDQRPMICPMSSPSTTQSMIAPKGIFFFRAYSHTQNVASSSPPGMAVPPSQILHQFQSVCHTVSPT